MSQHKPSLEKQDQTYKQRLAQEELAMERFTAQIKHIWLCPHCEQTAKTREQLRHLGTCPVAALQQEIAATRLILSQLQNERERQKIGID